jgi:zeta-carotene desaturase
VVGGGVAGIAASVALARAGARVVLIERRPFLGGRASSFVDRETGQMVDACRHVTLGCCTTFDGLLAAIGQAPNLKYMDAIPFQDRRGRRAEIRASPLPAPLHLAPSLMSMPWLSWRDRVSALKLVLAALSPRSGPSHDEEPGFAQWARDAGASPNLMRLVIEPLIASACNETSGDVALHHGLLVLRESLLRTRDGYRLGLPSVPLAELFTAPTVSVIERQGGAVFCRTSVSGVTALRGGGFAARLGDGSEVLANACILAVPYSSVARLAPHGTLTADFSRRVGLLRSAPIVATHLWFDRPVVCPVALGLLERRTHWIFGRESDPTYLSTVTSADRALAALPHEAVLTTVTSDVRQTLALPDEVGLRHARVVIERSATFVPYPGIEAVRPSARTPMRALAIAGEWTATGWPSTMEGAARSGAHAASIVLADLSR